LAKKVELLTSRLEEEIRSRTTLEGVVKRLDKLLTEESQKRAQLEKKIDQLLGTSPVKERPTPPPSPAPVEKKYRANYDYTAKEENELSFSSGEIITVIKEHASGWWLGTIDGKTKGMFPVAYAVAI
jgi:predicted RNase H-like nuclease (RuvC/YqgF family)